MSKALKLGLALSGILLSNAALADNNGWYIGGKLGASLVEVSDLRYDNKNEYIPFGFSWGDKTKAGFNVGVQGGYNFATHYDAGVRLEIESTYRTEAKTNKTINIYSDPVKASVKTQIYTSMLNAYFDVDTGTVLTPYVSLGIGLSHVDADFNFTIFDASASKSETNLAWAAGAGVYYRINQNLDLDLGYRYLDAGKVKTSIKFTGMFDEEASAKFITHDLTLGLRYSF